MEIAWQGYPGAAASASASGLGVRHQPKGARLPIEPAAHGQRVGRRCFGDLYDPVAGTRLLKLDIDLGFQNLSTLAAAAAAAITGPANMAKNTTNTVAPATTMPGTRGTSIIFSFASSKNITLTIDR